MATCKCQYPSCQQSDTPIIDDAVGAVSGNKANDTDTYEANYSRLKSRVKNYPSGDYPAM